jgi:zinc transport system substrate-binding protein
MMKRSVLLLFITFCCTAMTGPTPVYAAGGMTVFVSILPQQYFVERVGGDRVKVSVMVAPGANPATYEPKPGQMAKMAGARIYFAVGVPFESVWLEKFASANPGMKIVGTDAGIRKIQMASHGHGEQKASDGTRYRHTVTDPHVWTSPPLVKIMAENIRDALIGADPENKSVYDDNCEQFIREIDELDSRLRELFSEIKPPKAFMVFHPSWGYFAAAYGLKQIPVEMEGKNPKPAYLGRLIDRARADGIKVIFVQPQFSAKSAKIVADAIGGRVVHADPLARNWGENLIRQAEQFRSAME